MLYLGTVRINGGYEEQYPNDYMVRFMTEKRFKYQRKHQGMVNGRKEYANCIIDENENVILTLGFREDCIDVCELLNELHEENEQLKTFLEALKEELSLADIYNTQLEKENKELRKDLNDCKKLKGKRLNKIRNHRAVIEDLGGSIRAYKGQISQLNEKIEKIQEAMQDTGALTKRQLEMILND